MSRCGIGICMKYVYDEKFTVIRSRITRDRMETGKQLGQDLSWCVQERWGLICIHLHVTCNGDCHLIK